MRYLILTDIHANMRALEAVLADCSGAYEQVVCCGDLVGYNANPDVVTDWVQAHSSFTVRGNHDKVVAGVDDIEWFNEVAQAAARWTVTRITSQQLEWLRGLPQGPLQLEHFEIWHGSPADEDEYLTSTRSAEPRFTDMRMPLAFFGHTHVQGGFFNRYGRVGQIAPVPHDATEMVFQLEPDSSYMINPGSVGQPRDTDPRAAYALYDSDQRLVTLRRVPYAIAETAAEIRAAGLPDVLGLRLFVGR